MSLLERRHESLTSYLPPYVLRALGRGDVPEPPYSERLDGAVLLGDVRGFTRLTEQMAERGPDGVETLTVAMNRYFGGMIDLVGEYGGGGGRLPPAALPPPPPPPPPPAAARA